MAEPNAQGQDSYEDWSAYPDGEGDPNVAAAEGAADDEMTKMRKQLAQLTQRFQAEDEQNSVDKIIDDFRKDATPEALEFAEIFLDGVETRAQAEKAIEKVKARAAKLNPEANIQPPAQSAQAFAPPAEGSPTQPKSEWERTHERALKGNREAQLAVYLGSNSTQGLPEEKKLTDIFGMD